MNDIDDHIDAVSAFYDALRREMTMRDERYKGMYIGVRINVVTLSELPERKWWDSRELNSMYILYSLMNDQYSYQPASGIINKAYRVHVVETQEEFVSYVLARELNVDLSELFNGKPNS